MNIHCMDTFTILLLAVSLASAQSSWSRIFGYHPNDNYFIPSPVIEIPRPRIIHIYDDDYSQPQPLRQPLHFFDHYDHPTPVIYLPRVHVEPEIYVDDLPSHYRHRFQEPPYLNRLMTTLTYTYNTRVVRVIDKDEKDEKVADSSASASDTVSNAVTNKGTTKKDKNAETTSSTGSVKKVTPKPGVEAVPKSDAGEKPDDNKTTESTTKVDATKVSEDKVAGVEPKPVEGETDANSDSTTSKDSDNDGNSETENSEGSTTDADVPAA